MAAYPQRSDLRSALPKKAVPGQPYGEATKQLAAQEAVPMGASPADAPPLAPFDRETERPDEPITAGAPFGPGPGPEAVGFAAAPPAPGSPQAILEQLQALWAIPEARNANLAALINAVGARAGMRRPSAQVDQGLRSTAGQTIGLAGGWRGRERAAANEGVGRSPGDDTGRGA